MARTVYVARERETTAIPLGAVLRGGKVDILPAVRGRDYFDIRFQGDRLWITAGKYIGVVPLNDEVAIRVEPKGAGTQSDCAIDGSGRPGGGVSRA